MFFIISWILNMFATRKTFQNVERLLRYSSRKYFDFVYSSFSFCILIRTDTCLTSSLFSRSSVSDTSSEKFPSFCKLSILRSAPFSLFYVKARDQERIRQKIDLAFTLHTDIYYTLLLCELTHVHIQILRRSHALRKLSF